MKYTEQRGPMAPLHVIFRDELGAEDCVEAPLRGNLLEISVTVGADQLDSLGRILDLDNWADLIHMIEVRFEGRTLVETDDHQYEQLAQLHTLGIIKMTDVRSLSLLHLAELLSEEIQDAFFSNHWGSVESVCIKQLGGESATFRSDPVPQAPEALHVQCAPLALEVTLDLIIAAGGPASAGEPDPR